MGRGSWLIKGFDFETDFRTALGGSFFLAFSFISDLVVVVLASV
jgi:hypothetical protein